MTEGSIHVGISAWTEPTLVAAGVFYPEGTSSAEARLRYYASRFGLVEADSPFYALPTPDLTSRWAERTPPGFVFDVKAHALMTGHATDPARLPRALRDALPPALARERRVRAVDFPPEIVDEAWRLFAHALEPLREAGKLGAVLLQYPPWFGPTRENAARIVQAGERLAGVRPAIELRHAGWFEGRVGARTIEFLREHALPFVMVDEPQGLPNSVPPVHAVTSPALAVVRFHGRRAETWARSTATAAERFRYLYDDAELREWVAPIRDAANAASAVHVVFNNCYANYATTNALEMGALLAR